MENFFSHIERLHAQGNKLTYNRLPEMLHRCQRSDIVPVPVLFKQFIARMVAAAPVGTFLEPSAGIGELSDHVVRSCSPEQAWFVTHSQQYQRAAMLFGHSASKRWTWRTVGWGANLWEGLGTARNMDLVVSFPPLPGLLGNKVLRESCRRLSSRGMGIFLMPPNFLWTPKGASDLHKLGLRIKAALLLPKGLLRPYAPIPLVIVVIEQGAPQPVYCANLDSEKSVGAAVDAIRSLDQTKPPIFGMFVPPDKLPSLQNLLEHGLPRTRTSNQRQAGMPIGHIAEIHLGRRSRTGGFVKVANAVYLPMIGVSDAVTDAAALRLKPHNYAQLIIRQDVALAEFVAIWLNSEHGHRWRKNLTTGFIPKLTKRSLDSATLPLPSLDKQREAIGVHRQMTAIRDRISQMPGRKAPMDKRRLRQELLRLHQFLGGHLKKLGNRNKKKN